MHFSTFGHNRQPVWLQAKTWHWHAYFSTKQTVSYYVNKDNSVFSVFLDATKAFDRTNHNLLFVKVIKRNVPMCKVRLLLSWYRQQTMQVKWGTNYSSPFTVTNGVRQGGVLSPYLFAVYLDKLSIQLGSARVRWTVGNMVVNHLMFADDICVFSPSICGQQCLLNICGDYAAEHQITFNCNKTIGVLFCPKKYKQRAPSNVFLSGVRVQFFDQVKYLGVWINASLKDDDVNQRQVKSLYCAANKLRGTFDQCTPAVKKHFVSCLLHANVCFPIVGQIYADQYEALTYAVVECSSCSWVVSVFASHQYCFCVVKIFLRHNAKIEMMFFFFRGPQYLKKKLLEISNWLG